MREVSLRLELVLFRVVPGLSLQAKATDNQGRVRFRGFPCAQDAMFNGVPKLEVLAASVFDLGVDVGENDRDPDGDRHRLFTFRSRWLEVLSVVKVELLDWRKSRNSVWAQDEI